MSISVAQMNLSGAWGGMEMSTLKIAQHFQRRDFKSFVITSVASPLAKEAAKAGLHVIEIAGEGHFAPKASWRLRQQLRAQGISVVMVHQLRNLWILRPALWGMPDVRVIGFARMFLKDIKKTDFLHRHLYLRIEKMVTLSQVQCQAIEPCLPLPHDRYVVIPNGVDTERFHPRHRNEEMRLSEFGATGREAVIGVIGRLDPQKGQMEFINAAALVLKKYPRTRFVVVGEETVGEPGYAERLRQKARDLGIAERVLFLGHRTDTPKVMASLDVFVMPSYEEAFGNVVLEAMASGVPVIATKAGGPLDIVRDDWGQLVAPREFKPLAEAIMRYLDDESWAKEQGENGRAEAERRYPLPIVMGQIESLI
ncbi:MAG: glycosyltransferase family 4 protein [Bdellovibrionales bacterium]